MTRSGPELSTQTADAAVGSDPGPGSSQRRCGVGAPTVPATRSRRLRAGGAVVAGADVLGDDHRRYRVGGADPQPEHPAMRSPTGMETGVAGGTSTTRADSTQSSWL